MGKKVTVNQMNDLYYTDYYNRLKMMCLNVFEWINLPPSIDERKLELSLYNLGSALYFNDIVLGNLGLPCTLSGLFDVYDVPKQRQVITKSGYNNTLTDENSVVIWNNDLRIPTSNTIDIFARRLANIDRTIDVNLNAQKTPIIILCEDRQRLTMQNLYKQYEGNAPFIFGNKGIDLDDFKVLNTKADFVAEKLQMVKHQLWDECMSFIGVENSNTDKKERLVESEVGGNNGTVENNRYTQLKQRKDACKKINEMFGTNIDVTIRSNLDTALNAEFSTISEGDKDE